MSFNSLTRIRVISLAISLFVVLIISRLYFLQIIKGEDYTNDADRQYVNPNQTLFDRGTIYFEDKDSKLISAATLKTGYTLSINNKLLKDASLVHKKIEEIIDIDDETFFFRAGKKDDPHEDILKKIEEEKALKIEGLDIEGVEITKEKWRFYPGNEVGASMLGFVGFNKDNFGGRY